VPRLLTIRKSAAANFSSAPSQVIMAFTAQDIRANRDYFLHKLHAEKQRNEVLKAVEGKRVV